MVTVAEDEKENNSPDTSWPFDMEFGWREADTRILYSLTDIIVTDLGNGYTYVSVLQLGRHLGKRIHLWVGPEVGSWPHS